MKMEKLTVLALVVAGLALVQGDPLQCPSKNGLFPIRDDCTSYLICRNGTGRVRHCPEDFRYDSVRHCTPEEEADCGYPTPEQLEINSYCKEFYGYSEYPSDCRKYVYCNAGRGQLRLCPPGHVYVSHVGCLDPGDYPTPQCLCKNGFFPVRGDCTAFLWCRNGTGTVHLCPKDFRYDSIHRCTLDKEADCGFPSIDQREINSRCEYPIGNFPYPSDCRKFVSCNGGRGKLTPCPEGTVFKENVGCLESDECFYRPLSNK